MISFLALRNGTPLGTGGVGEGVLTAILTRVTEQPGARPAELTFSLSGLETSHPQEERLDWLELRDLDVGDEITIRVQEAPADPPTRRKQTFRHRSGPDGSEQLQCSFCNRFRAKQGCVAGANVIICLPCRVLAAELLERQSSSVFHLKVVSGASCSFCNRPDRAATVVADAEGICSECIAAVPFAT